MKAEKLQSLYEPYLIVYLSLFVVREMCFFVSHSMAMSLAAECHSLVGSYVVVFDPCLI